MTDAVAARGRRGLVRQAFVLEYLTLSWMVIEGAVGIGSGIAARSLSLLVFGIDSLIELASAALLIWRLTVELRRGQPFAEDAERKADSAWSTSLGDLTQPVSAVASERRQSSSDRGMFQVRRARCRGSIPPGFTRSPAA